MSNNPFDRTILHPLEKPLADDINQMMSNYDHALRFFMSALLKREGGLAVDGFLSTGLSVVPTSPAAMNVSVTAGLGFQTLTSIEYAIDGIIGLNDLERYKPLPLLANLGFTVPAAPAAPNTRIDIIEVRADRLVTDSSNRQVFNEITGQFEPGILNKTLQWALDGRAGSVSSPSVSTEPLSYKIGTAGNPGLAPVVSPGYVKIAEIAVGSDVTSIVAADITDYREVLTERIVKLHIPATNGWLGVGSATQKPGGYVDIVGTGLWQINVGDGIEAGDIIEDIVVIVERVNGASNDLQTNFEYSEVDLDVPSVTLDVTFSQSNTGPVAPLGIYEIHHKNATLPVPNNAYPFTWKAGSSGTLQVVSATQDDRVYGAFVIIRRPILKRDL